MDREFFATCTLGLESVLIQELAGLGATEVSPTRGGASFKGDLELGYRANLWLRSATRVQELLVEEAVRDADELYEICYDLAWDQLMGVDQTLAVDATVRDSGIRHSGYAAQRVKDAAVDYFREFHGNRPFVDTESPDLPLQLMVRRDRMTLSRNLSGASLHKRGYRPIQVKSPLNEATAAGLILLAGIDPAQGLIDPMCGSATFLIEGAWIAADRAPGLSREFAFERWPDFDESLWLRIRDEAVSRVKLRLDGVEMIGTDQHRGAISLARRAVEAAGVGDVVTVRAASVRDLVPSASGGVLITNPPWGERLEQGAEESWSDLGRFLHQQWRGRSAFILCGRQELTRKLGLRATQRYPVWNGAIECRLLRYDVFDRPADPRETDETEPPVDCDTDGETSASQSIGPDAENSES